MNLIKVIINVKCIIAQLYSIFILFKKNEMLLKFDLIQFFELYISNIYIILFWYFSMIWL